MRKWNAIEASLYAIDSVFSKDTKIKEKYCEEWITAYREVIKKAADLCDIPPELLAGIAWIEVGGMHTFMDHVAYNVRNATDEEKAVLTSFGDLSMQVRRVAEVLRVNINNLSEKEKKLLIDTVSEAPMQIFLAAQHLSDLKNIDFPDKTGAELTVDDIKVIASRYNIGPDHDYEIALTNEYGDRVVEKIDFLLELLK